MRLAQAHCAGGADSKRASGAFSRFLFLLMAAAMSLTVPAGVCAQQPDQAGAAAAAKAFAGEDEAIRPFRVHVPQAELDDLRRRVAAAKLPERETVTDGSQDVQLATIRALARPSDRCAGRMGMK